jgi:hypothetical protein
MKKFHLSDVLSVTTGNLLSIEGMGGVYKILNYMTGSDLFTHQLPRASTTCKAYLISQYPLLKDVDISMLNTALESETDNEKRKTICTAFIDLEIQKHGEFLEVDVLPDNVYLQMDPIEEMEFIRGDNDMEIITIGEDE